ncbi:hypothetical protein P7L79_12635 [Tistrella mobilis]|uniref:hypothetical protein n=1 Tax=Tistrella mobilis TaxID=171437 RepID=UPI003556F383
MVQLASAAGVSLDWLATGASASSQPPSDAKQQVEPVDPQLMGTIVDAVRALYKGEGAAIPDRTLGEEAARIYGALAPTRHDVSATLIALGEILADRRRRLRESATDPSRSKRPA